MNKLLYGILFSLICNHTFSMAPVDPVTAKGLNARVQSIIHDLYLVKKCYFNRSVECSVDEKIKASKALRNSGIAAGVLLGILVSSKWIWNTYRQTQQTLSHGKRGNVQPQSERPLAKNVKVSFTKEQERILRLVQMQYPNVTEQDIKFDAADKVTIKVDLTKIQLADVQGFVNTMSEHSAIRELTLINKENGIIIPYTAEGPQNAPKQKLEPARHASKKEMLNFIEPKLPRRTKIKILSSGLIEVIMPNGTWFVQDAAQNFINEIHNEYPMIKELRLTQKQKEEEKLSTTHIKPTE